jgi:hypothetical protein
MTLRGQVTRGVYVNASTNVYGQVTRGVYVNASTNVYGQVTRGVYVNASTNVYGRAVAPLVETPRHKLEGRGFDSIQYE